MQSLRFLLNGEPVDAGGLSPQTTLLQFLRDQRGLSGTKEGCAEGDCGACTVMLVERNGDALAWNPINACIRLLPSLAARAVFTVEGLRGDAGELHPVQRALVETHGSQCGFCTPGFVMSLLGLYKSARRPSREAIDDALSGNLCRCTGYRPILAAADRMYELPAVEGHFACGVASDGTRVVSAEETRLANALAMLAHEQTIEGEGNAQRYFVPENEDALASGLAQHPDARIIAGATDAALWITKQHRDLGTLIFTSSAYDMARIERGEHAITIGAGASLTDAFAALDEDYPELDEAWVRFASPPIRNSGTLAGNVANGSPIGDSMPVLIALGATLVLRRGDTRREIAIEDFYLGYQKNALSTSEFIASIRVPRRVDPLVLRAWKISKRYDQDISAVFACFALRVIDATIVKARIGCGGVAAVPSRARESEHALIGQRFDRSSLEHAAEVLGGEFTPIDDMRASAGYRRRTLANLMRRLWLDAGEAIETRIAIPARDNA
ncbi:MAG TPA: xanthine dehydrogenase small subunit [Casimicrobiaceae bacterium]|nr:xanthine dehydrogenase small subunit [Casimicrobiaceae bacterium]